MTRSTTCQCDALLTADDTESLIGPAKAHYDEEHPEIGISEANIRNLLESEDRATGPTERLGAIGNLEIRPMTPGSGPDVVQFFDLDAFSDNPRWGGCYCMFHFRGGPSNENWGEEPWRENRQDQMARIGGGKTTGMLAYVDGRLAGWCNATARAELPGLAKGDDECVASVVCFVIAPPYRGHGVATQLLEGVIGGFTDLGFRRLEAYPVRDPRNERAAYHGSLDLFRRLGFEVTSEDPLVVRLDL